MASDSPDDELPEKVPAFPADVGGQVGWFAVDYPNSSSGTLTVVRSSGTLEVEVGSLSDPSDDELKQLAIKLGTVAVGRSPE